MSDTFRQLLKEFPKSTVAAQANYYIGKSAFDAKDYKACLAPLDAARQLNKEQVIRTSAGREKKVVADFCPAYDDDGGLLVALTPD